MGVARRVSDGRHVALSVRTLVGRSSIAQLHLDEPMVSGEHATLYFLEGCWRLKDLGSRNGTYLGKSRLEVGTAQRLKVGDRFSFGQAGSDWELVDDSAVGASARGSDGERAISSESSLWLPNESAPQSRIYPSGGDWLRESEEEAGTVTDGQVILIDEMEWTLELPPLPMQQAPGALHSTLDKPEFSDLSLAFKVSQDEEHVDLSATFNQKKVPLGSRAHNYLLLTLARRRIADMKEGGPDAEHGWMYADEVAEMLRMERGAVNVQVWRANQAFKSAKLPVDLLFERRKDSGQIRLGIADLQID